MYGQSRDIHVDNVGYKAQNEDKQSLKHNTKNMSNTNPTKNRGDVSSF